ncbi:MAG: hypothetical protein GTN64_05560 [Candidatus Latescibacteria bacterium]|nr:hypothetical protein [Candidatus Latescibacterota bacterium]NIO78076.1 hypothetical protein [Candidatus Latescibacterota bacterium]
MKTERKLREPEPEPVEREREDPRPDVVRLIRTIKRLRRKSGRAQWPGRRAHLRQLEEVACLDLQLRLNALGSGDALLKAEAESLLQEWRARP